MKAKIATTTPIKQEWLDEVKEHVPDIEFDITNTTEMLQTYYNTQTKTHYGIFQHLRQIVNAPKNQGYRYRVYNMTDAERKALGMSDHLAAYDNVDRDGVLDFYMGVPEKLQTKTKLNGLKYNWARVFIHECLHGKEQENGREYLSLTRPDRTHEYDDAGRLKELIAEHYKIRQGFLSVIAGLTKIVESLKKKANNMTNPEYLITHHGADARPLTLDEMFRIYQDTHFVSLYKKYDQPRSSGDFPDIAYHILVGTDGWAYARDLTMPGYHASNYPVNMNSIAICISGNYDRDRLTPQMEMYYREAVATIRKQLPSLKYCNGHRAYSNTKCPGDTITDEFIKEVFAGPVKQCDNAKAKAHIANALQDLQEAIKEL